MSDDESSTDDETALTRTSSDALQRLDTNLAATERVLARSEDRYVEFFQEHTEFCSNLLSRWYPLDLKLIDQYDNRWKWENLSKNKGLPWSEVLIDEYIHRWDWEKLSMYIPLTVGLIDRYYDRWDWQRLSGNRELPWTRNLIQKYSDLWDWNRLSRDWGDKVKFVV